MSSVLSKVRSSLRRAQEVCIGCTHTNGIDRSAASWPSTRHRCPVGSHETVTPAKPFAAARSAAQSNATPRSQALHRNVRRASTFESWSVTTTICFWSARSIPTIALVQRHQLPQPRQPCVAVPVTPRDTITVGHERPPYAMGHQARQAHQGDVPTSRPTRRTCFYAAIRAVMPMCRRRSAQTSAMGMRSEQPGSAAWRARGVAGRIDNQGSREETGQGSRPTRHGAEPVSRRLGRQS